MLRHVVMFRWRDDATDERIDAFLGGLRELLAADPYVRAHAFGVNGGKDPDNYDFALVADFDSYDDYLAYEATPAHDAFVARYASHVVGQRTAVQHPFREPT
ncbi:Dabb family protein [Streptosporangium sandarakinum]